MLITFQDYSKMRYATAGDYIEENGKWHFYIAKLSKRRYELCVALHEIIECYLCDWFSIKETDIMAFDLDYENRRAKGLNCKYDCKITETSEPGFDKHAPYFIFHLVATIFEWLLCKILFVSWRKYNDDVNNL